MGSSRRDENIRHKRDIKMSKILLEVPYLTQLDSTTGEAMRMCFSSSCSMMLNYLKPNAIKGTGQKDDIYLLQLEALGGDSTDAASQLRTLKHYGLNATYHQDGNWAAIDAQLAKGIPVPIGILHHGPVSAPSGGGHWVLIVGRSEDGLTYYVNDPAGELDLLNGGYHLQNNGKMRHYSKENLGKRWMVDGPNTGWYIKGEK